MKSIALSQDDAELKHDSVRELPIRFITKSPENDEIYGAVSPNDPEVIELAESIERDGILEPLVVTKDHVLVSGHRRLLACRLAGLKEVRCRVLATNRDDYDRDAWFVLLREHNRQREKSFAVKLKEELIDVTEEDAYEALLAHREEAAKVKIKPFKIDGTKKRCAISSAKALLVAAVLAVLEDRRKYWPLSERAIHYAVLNDPPLRHASKPKSKYRNDKDSYSDLTNLITRLRLTGEIPWEAICDETRPVTIFDVFSDVRGFIRREVDWFLEGYRRDLMQSQTNHIEILGEKNTLGSILKPVAKRYCIPFTIGRGYSSLPPRYEMAERFRESGKSKLVLIIVSDFDPDGESIANSFAKSMRDDFGIEKIHPVKAALTAAQVKKYKIPPGMKAKKKSPNYTKFVEKFGENVFEVEALNPDLLQSILREVIDSVIDTRAFNHELDAERADALHMRGVKKYVVSDLKGMDLTEARGE